MQRALKFKAIVWLEVTVPSSWKTGGDHQVGTTPFGNFLIKWQSWDEFPAYVIAEGPCDIPKVSYTHLEAARKACQAALETTIQKFIK